MVAFADEYYEQLLEVFARQGLVPPYKVDRVRALVRHLEPTGWVPLLLRARDSRGECIAPELFSGLTKLQNSGAMPVSGPARSCDPTKRSIGTPCATGRS